MNLDQMVADAKERLHRSIGQRARYAKQHITHWADERRQFHGEIHASLRGQFTVRSDAQPAVLKKP